MYIMEDSWFINDGGVEYGPHRWAYILEQVKKKKITDRAFVRNEMHPQWVPLSYYIPSSQLMSPDEIGIIPSRWDLVFYLGLGLFILGIFAFFMNMYIGAVCLGLSPGIEVFAILKDQQEKVESMASKVGNICAVMWIIFQIAMTAFIVIILV